MSVDESKALFNCHHAGCGFHGGSGALRKRLGIERQWLPRAEYIRQQRTHERVRKAAIGLADAVHAWRLDLLKELDSLHALARKAKADSPEAWDALALVYSRRPFIIAELVFLESVTAPQLQRFLAATRQQRRGVCEAILERGGMFDFARRFAEVSP